MVVYWEYAFAENCLLDGLLLYLALKIARGKVAVSRLVVASAVGGAEALVFPLIPFPVWAAYIVKFAGGALLVLLAVKRGTKKTYFVALVSFFALTFALGGALTAIYSFFGAEYAEGSGYLVERAPAALVLAAAGIFAVICLRAAGAFYRYRSLRRNVFPCEIKAGDNTVMWKAFADSGNRLEFRGEPVCVLSPAAALALFRGRERVGRITVSTVNGSRDAPVFRCDEMRLFFGKQTKCYRDVCFTVGDLRSKEYSVLLHGGMAEDKSENFDCAESMAEKSEGRRERRPLSLRKRGAPVAALSRGGTGIPAKDGAGRGCGGGEGEAHRA